MKTVKEVLRKDLENKKPTVLKVFHKPIHYSVKQNSLLVRREVERFQ